jgi:hypothetical protein
LSPTKDHQRQNLANSDPSVHQALRQQAGPGSYGIIRIHVWSGFVTSERKEEEEEYTIMAFKTVVIVVVVVVVFCVSELGFQVIW